MKTRSKSGASALVKAESRMRGVSDPIKLSHLKVQRNSFATVTRLFPVEIFIKIFFLLQSSIEELDEEALYNWFVSSEGAFVSTRWNWTTVTHVCHQWREIALRCPRLWAQINSGTHTNPMQTKTYLKRSGSSTLFVRHVPDFGSQISHKVSTKCLQLVLEQLPRIQDLRITINTGRHIARVRELLSQPAPKLNSFRISWWENVGDTAAYSACLKSLFGGDAPRLRTLRLHVQLFHWDSPLFQNLQSLTLRQVESPLKISDILNILRACPNLEDFNVHACNVVQDDDVELEPVNLPKLKDLELIGVNTAVFDKLIKCMRYPNEISWAFNLDEYPSLHQDPPMPTIVNRKTPCKYLRLSFACYSLAIEDVCTEGLEEDKYATLNLNWDPPTLAIHVFEFSSRIIKGGFWCNATTLEVDLSDGTEWTIDLGENESCWTMLLELLPNVKVLKVAFEADPEEHSAVDQVALMSALMHRNDTDGSYLCPQLSEVVLECALFDDDEEEFFEELQKCLDMRSRVGLRIQQLEIIDGYGVSSDMIDILEGLGVVGKVVWDGVCNDSEEFDDVYATEDGESSDLFFF